jgi:hypothetical protein
LHCFYSGIPNSQDLLNDYFTATNLTTNPSYQTNCTVAEPGARNFKGSIPNFSRLVSNNFDTGKHGCSILSAGIDQLCGSCGFYDSVQGASQYPETMTSDSNILVHPGDGIGPDVNNAGVRVPNRLCSSNSIQVRLQYDLLSSQPYEIYGEFCRNNPCCCKIRKRCTGRGSG